jgi:regulator of RNase E activity RraA
VLPTQLKPHCETGLPIDFGGARIYPGDIVVGDDDGAVIIPRGRLDEVVYQIELVAQIEKEVTIVNKDNPNMSLPDFLAILDRKKIPRK